MYTIFQTRINIQTVYDFEGQMITYIKIMKCFLEMDIGRPIYKYVLGQTQNIGQKTMSTSYIWHLEIWN